MALHRAHGQITYRTAKLAGLPRATVVRWVQVYGPDFGKPSGVPAIGDGTEGADVEVRESDGERLATLVKLGRVRGLYLDRLAVRDVVERTPAKDAAAVVQSVTAQIQLLTGQATNRTESKVSYVPKGGLRAFARSEQIERKIIDVVPADRRASVQSEG